MNESSGRGHRLRRRTISKKVWRGDYLEQNKKTLIGTILLPTGIFLLILSSYMPQIMTPTEWVNQINDPQDVEPPRAERFRQFDPGDIVYIEGEIISIDDNFIKTRFRIADNQESCVFASTENYSNIKVGDHVFLKVEIIETWMPDGGYILSGNDPYYFKEEAILIDIEKEYSSYKSIFMFSGIIIFTIGLIVVLYFLLYKKKIDEVRIEHDNDESKE